jgi:hypothetical protein
MGCEAIIASEHYLDITTAWRACHGVRDPHRRVSGREATGPTTLVLQYVPRARSWQGNSITFYSWLCNKVYDRPPFSLDRTLPAEYIVSVLASHQARPAPDAGVLDPGATESTKVLRA